MNISKNKYVVYFEPMDVEAENQDDAMRKVKYITTTVNRIILVDKNGLPML